MPKKSKKKVEENSQRSEELDLLQEKHRIELEEFIIRQRKEELRFRMQKSNVKAEFFPTTQFVEERHSENESVVSFKTQPSCSAHEDKLSELPSNIAEATSVVYNENKSSGLPSNIAEVVLKSQEEQRKLVAAIQMPKVELQAFDGNSLQYWSFIRLFESSVNSDTDAIGKLTRLIQYTSGKAKRAIQGCTIMEPTQGYEKAMKILKDRFGSDQAISEAWIAKVSDGPAIKMTNYEGFRDLADKLQNCYCIL
jgi:hypothetical protein